MCQHVLWIGKRRRHPERSLCGVCRAKSLASLYTLGVRAGFAFLALSQALSKLGVRCAFCDACGYQDARKGLECVQSSDITAAPLLFADDIVLLVSLELSVWLFSNTRLEQGASGYDLKVPFRWSLSKMSQQCWKAPKDWMVVRHLEKPKRTGILLGMHPFMCILKYHTEKGLWRRQKSEKLAWDGLRVSKYLSHVTDQLFSLGLELHLRQETEDD